MLVENGYIKKSPKGWSEKRLRITNRITAMVRNSGDSSTLEERPIEPTAKADNISERPKASKKGRLELSQRHPDLVRVKQYTCWKRKMAI